MPRRLAQVWPRVKGAGTGLSMSASQTAQLMPWMVLAQCCLYAPAADCGSIAARTGREAGRHAPSMQQIRMEAHAAVLVHICSAANHAGNHPKHRQGAGSCVMLSCRAQRRLKCRAKSRRLQRSSACQPGWVLSVPGRSGEPLTFDATTRLPLMASHTSNMLKCHMGLSATPALAGQSRGLRREHLANSTARGPQEKVRRHSTRLRAGGEGRCTVLLLRACRKPQRAARHSSAMVAGGPHDLRTCESATQHRNRRHIRPFDTSQKMRASRVLQPERRGKIVHSRRLKPVGRGRCTVLLLRACCRLQRGRGPLP